jgi:hypothetical protein
MSTIKRSVSRAGKLYYSKAEAHAEAERLNKLYDEPAFLYIPVLVRDVRWSILKERIA